MKILVIGAEGQVGNFFLSTLAPYHEMHGTSVLPDRGLPVLDIRDARAVERHIAGLNPDHVILTAAMTHVDRCEDEPDTARAINVTGPEHVAQACNKTNASMTFFSTDYVFDGEQGPYRETDKPNPQSVYAKTKLEAEDIVSTLVDRHLIIRPMFVFSYLVDSVNFFMQIYHRVLQGQPITVPHDQIGNPTHAVNLTQIVGELVELQAWGLYHVVGTTRLSKAEFARKIVQKLGKDPDTVQMVSTSEFKQKAPRPLNSGLVVEKVQQTLRKHKVWSLEEALVYSLEQKKKASQ